MVRGGGAYSLRPGLTGFWSLQGILEGNLRFQTAYLSTHLRPRINVVGLMVCMCVCPCGMCACECTYVCAHVGCVPLSVHVRCVCEHEDLIVVYRSPGAGRGCGKASEVCGDKKVDLVGKEKHPRGGHALQSPEDLPSIPGYFQD